MTRRSFVALLGGLAGVLGGVTALPGAARAVPAGIRVGAVIGRLRVTGWHRYGSLPGSIGFRVEALDTRYGERVRNAVRVNRELDAEALAVRLLTAWLEDADHWRFHAKPPGDDWANECMYDCLWYLPSRSGSRSPRGYSRGVRT